MGEQMNEIKGMEAGLPRRVFGRDVVVVRGVGGSVVGTDGVLSFSKQWGDIRGFEQRSSVMG